MTTWSTGSSASAGSNGSRPGFSGSSNVPSSAKAGEEATVVRYEQDGPLDNHRARALELFDRRNVEMVSGLVEDEDSFTPRAATKSD